MSQSRDEMIAELKRVAVPVLRSHGFKGSFPHFRRESGTRIDLLTFQFSTGGGEFVVEIGSFPVAGYELYGKLIPTAEVKMRHLLRRLRLGAKDESSDHWFNYDNGEYAGVAAAVVPYICGQAIEWWSQAEPNATPDPAASRSVSRNVALVSDASRKSRRT
jgi:hypothetical protein